jgi:hypothetical protein
MVMLVIVAMRVVAMMMRVAFPGWVFVVVLVAIERQRPLCP